MCLNPPLHSVGRDAVLWTLSKYCWWDCPPIKNILCQIQTLIEDVTGVDLPFYPDLQFRKDTAETISVLMATIQ